MKSVRLVQFYCVLLTGSLIPGCWEKGPSNTTVKGQVFFSGKHLTRGTIVFTSDIDRGGKGDMVSAEIKTDGSYVLKPKHSEGMEPGWYRVTILALEAPRAVDEGDNPGELRSLLPERYRDPNLSGLSVEVLPDQANVKDFHLD
jgi:hypothetical protein